MNGPAIVTGAAGFVGSHLLSELTSNGIPAVGWWNPAGRSPSDSAASRWQAVDILDRSRVAEALRERTPAAIYHCAGAAHLGASWATTTETYERNVRGTHHLLEGAGDAGLDSVRILIPGSAAIYAPSSEPIREDHPLAPASPYGLSKLAQELLARRAFEDLDQQVLITRSFNHIGPGQDSGYAASSFARQIAQIEAGQLPPVIEVGNLDAERDLTDVRDTVRAYRAVLERGRPGRVYNVCSGRPYSMREVLDLLVSQARVPVDINANPALFRPSDTPMLVGDPSRVRDEIGWSPTIPLERTLADLLDDWRRRVSTGTGRGSAGLR